MSLVKAGDLVRRAERKNTAVIGFICIDYNMVSAVIRAAEITGKPAIIMLLPEYVQRFEITKFAPFAAMVREMAQETDAEIALHLDHSYSEQEVVYAIGAGFKSVMFDASMHDLETNIRRTRAMVEYAHKNGVSLEAELGAIGLGSDNTASMTDLYTKPGTVAKFVKETGIDSLAISIGNAHGDYPYPPKLDLERLDAINAVTDVPLVLHGGSGIPEDQLREAFARGINKFNYGTDVLHVYDQAVRAYHEAHLPASSLDFLGVGQTVRRAMTDLIVRKMGLVDNLLP